MSTENTRDARGGGDGTRRTLADVAAEQTDRSLDVAERQHQETVAALERIATTLDAILETIRAAKQ